MTETNFMRISAPHWTAIKNRNILLKITKHNIYVQRNILVSSLCLQENSHMENTLLHVNIRHWFQLLCMHLFMCFPIIWSIHLSYSNRTWNKIFTERDNVEYKTKIFFNYACEQTVLKQEKVCLILFIIICIHIIYIIFSWITIWGKLNWKIKWYIVKFRR